MTILRVLKHTSLPVLLLLLSAAPGDSGAVKPWLPSPLPRAQKTQISFDLTDVEGQRHSDREWRGKQAVVLFFIEAECPISTRYVPEMNRLASRYAMKGFIFYGVESDPSLGSAREAKRRMVGFEYGFPILLDPAQRLARHTGVTLTPEVAVLSDSGDLLYRGRIDDRYVTLSKYHDKATSEDLRLALDAIQTGKPVPVRLTSAVGCYLFTPVEERARQ